MTAVPVIWHLAYALSAICRMTLRLLAMKRCRRTCVFGAIWVFSVATFFAQKENIRIHYSAARNDARIEQPIAACLLLKDDNHFLPEWLAYHFFVLPLGSLIVAVDPSSMTSPTHIFDRWKDSSLNITLWNDSDFMDDKSSAGTLVKKRHKHRNPIIDLVQHRNRQRMFYYRCMQEHKRAGATFTMLIDTDEYLMVNYATMRRMRKNFTAVSISTPGSVWKTLKHEQDNHPNDKYTKSPCIQIPRVRFGSVETDPSEIDLAIPDELEAWNWNASHFATLRWRTHTEDNEHNLNKISKVLVDVNRLQWKHLQPVTSIHRPVKPFCTSQKMLIHPADQLFVIHHYLGTWEQFSYRDDPRAKQQRSRTRFAEDALTNKTSRGIDAIGWLKGFVKKVGPAKASYYLEGTGILDPKI